MILFRSITQTGVPVRRPNSRAFLPARRKALSVGVFDDDAAGFLKNGADAGLEIAPANFAWPRTEDRRIFQGVTMA